MEDRLGCPWRSVDTVVLLCRLSRWHRARQHWTSTTQTHDQAIRCAGNDGFEFNGLVADLGARRASCRRSGGAGTSTEHGAMGISGVDIVPRVCAQACAAVIVHAVRMVGEMSRASALEIGWMTNVHTSTIRVIVRAGHISHDIVLALRRHGLWRIVLSWIAEEEAHVGDGVVAFGRLKTANSIFETIGRDAVVEAAPLHGLPGDADDLLDATRGVHDGQGAGKAIKE